MNCETIQEQLGGYVDGELRSEAQEVITTHVAGCHACRRELRTLQSLAADLAKPPDADVPENLWAAVEKRLDAEQTPARRSRAAWRHRVPFRAAAMLALVVGVGALVVVWSDRSVSKAQASPINFGIILDTLPLDAEEAFRKFLVLYQAEKIRPSEAKRLAPELNFDMPETLPGGFRCEEAYALQFGESTGIAARYDRQGEFLVTIFHRAVFEEDFGTHRDYPCVVGKHRGHKVEVGDWKLVHVTDPTTCHCVLSRLDEATELPGVLSAVAPGSTGNTKHDHGSSGH
jgi:hypothetical protein